MLLTCWVAATMNPGYKGCTVIPDGLQAQLRPIAMLVPDYGLIAQINCLSFGFSQWLHILLTFSSESSDTVVTFLRRWGGG